MAYLLIFTPYDRVKLVAQTNFNAYICYYFTKL